MNKRAVVFIVAGLVVVGMVAAVASNKHPRSILLASSSPLPSSAATTPPGSEGEGAPTETPALAAGVLPNRTLTPGAVAETTIAIVCHRSTRTVRPPESYTEQLKIAQIREYGYSDTRLSDYEEDHLIPLELGGDPTSPRNLWPEPHYTHPNSYDKDRVENAAHSAVCDGSMSLAHAQSLMASDWVALGHELAVM
jgi:hypothetical protein